MLNFTMNSDSLPFSRFSSSRNGNRNNEDWRRKRISTYGCNVHRKQYCIQHIQCCKLQMQNSPTRRKWRRKVTRNGNSIAFVENTISFLKYNLQALRMNSALNLSSVVCTCMNEQLVRSFAKAYQQQQTNRSFASSFSNQFNGTHANTYR